MTRRHPGEGPATWDLRLGDCLDPVTGMASLGDKSADHVITDPPYDEHTHGAQRRGSATSGRGKQFGLSTTTISVERHVGFAALSDKETAVIAGQLARLSRRWSLAFCAMEQQRAWMDGFLDAGIEHVRFGLWIKPGSTPQFTGDRPGTGSEAIEIAHPPGKKRWNGGGGFGLWTVPIVKEHTGERCHPTQKPVELMERLIRDFTDPSDLILDPFAGSGTTGVAAIRLGRRFIGWERDPKYHAIAVKRLTAAREQLELCA